MTENERKPRQHDYIAQEADVLLTAIIYERTNTSVVKLNLLGEKIQHLKNKILKP